MQGGGINRVLECLVLFDHKRPMDKYALRVLDGVRLSSQMG